MRLRKAPEGAAAEFARAERPPDDTPWREARWCALDLEMTGLDPRSEEIIAVGAVPIEAGRIVLGGGMYTLVNTTRRSQHGAVLVHKLRVPDLADAPPLSEALDLVFEILAGRVPVFHTAAVERSFLERQFARRRVRWPAMADTEALGRAWLRHRDGSAPEGISLGRLADVLGQPAETPHHALGDALTTAKAFIALASLLDTVAPQTVGSLVAASRPAAALRRFGPG
ncbi:MAG TPA: 3'-5' exonuclease [Solirubrobacteraceae bacterium]|nr:3'-5' exonuclease [Solirubrobacteraceae bacterium]